MGDYVDIDGHSTWVETSGHQKLDADTVLALHGGLSNSDELLNVIGAPIGEHWRVVAFDRRGHGRTADTEQPFHYDDMATETIGVLETVVGGAAHLVGWSDGGIVALLVALRRPELVHRLVLIGTNFHFNGLRALDVGPDSPVFAMLQSAYAERSPDGADHFEAIAMKSLEMFASEPTLTVEDLARISSPALVLVGDDDAIELSHTCALYESMPSAQLAVIPGSSHVVPIEKPADVCRVIIDFLLGDAYPQTLMPSRRVTNTAAPA
jgi:pimeloyl-ACP methyl ester carboxylesterase